MKAYLNGPIIVSLTRFEASLFPGPVPSPPSPPAKPLREVEASALKAAPPFHHHAVTVIRLARLAGYAYTSYFRVAVQHLVDAGLLVRDSRGVRRNANI